MQLMVRCGLRVDEVGYSTRDRLRWSSSGRCWFLEVRGKNTKGGSRQTRDVWVPEEVAENIQRFASERDRDATDPLVSDHPFVAGFGRLPSNWPRKEKAIGGTLSAVTIYAGAWRRIISSSVASTYGQ